MRDYLRDIREVQSAAYLSQVINDVVPLEDDVSLARARTSRVPRHWRLCAAAWTPPRRTPPRRPDTPA